MYSHHIDQMVKAVENNPTHIREAIESCWKDKIAITWSIHDIISRAEDIGITITPKVAREILDKLLHKFDANCGVNWDIIDDEIIDRRPKD